MINAEDKAHFDKTIANLVKYVTEYQQNHDELTERRMLDNILELYYKDLPREFVPNYLSELYAQAQNPTYKFLGFGVGDLIYEKSMFFSTDRLAKVLKILKFDNSRKRKIQKFYDDPLLRLANEMEKVFKQKVSPYVYAARLRLDSLNRLYMRAQMEFDTARLFYPDANFTMRIAYGQIKGYKPRDAVWYYPFTTLKGVIEKNDPDIYDYAVPKRLIELYQNRDYGRYADKDGTLHTCFIANNHTTGGNSGSPVLDANGNLVGLNFDRSWESTMSDLMYDPSICRNIMVDIRYVLFIIDKYANAKNIIDELEFVD
jgi:hypothetical protein